METNNKLREALEATNKFLESAITDGKVTAQDITALRDIVSAARSEPVRNCDVGTAKEQEQRYLRLKKEHIDKLTRCPHVGCAVFFPDSLYWAQMPYEEGGAE